MILQCEKCNYKYLVPDTAIGVGGRTVRCAHCQHNWFVKPPANLEQTLASINAAPPPTAAKPIPKGSNLPALLQFKTTPMALKAACAALAFVVLVLAVLLAWPGLFGFANSKDFVLADVKLTRHEHERRPHYSLAGNILNTGDEEKHIPHLRVTLVDDEGSPLDYWDVAVTELSLAPGKTVAFDTGELDVRFSKDIRFVVELGNGLELALRDKP